MSFDCDNCSAATPTAMMTVLNSFKLCPECAQNLGKHCSKKGIQFEVYLHSSSRCGRCTGNCTWG